MPVPTVLALVVAGLWSAPPGLRTQTPTSDPVIATVREVEIRWSDLIDEMDRLIPLNFYHRRVPAEQMVGFRQKALDQLVEKHLIHLDAQDAGLVATEAELRAAFDAALREAGAAYERLTGSARDQLREQVRPALLKRVLIEKNEARIAARVPQVDEPMVRSVYDQRIAADEMAFMAPKEAHFFHVFVAVDPARIAIDEPHKRARIDAALAELQKGTPFADVARSYSEDEFAAQGGDLGYQAEGAFRMKAIGDEAFRLQPGETSAVIRALDGFHLLFCADVRPPHRLSFGDVRPELEAWLRDEHRKVTRGRWLADLRAKYGVRILRQDLLDAAPANDEGQAGPKK